MPFQANSVSDIERAVRAVDIFQDASDEDIRAIAALGIQRTMEEGGHFFLQGEPATHLYILLSGRTKLFQLGADGQQVNVRTLVPGQLFGAIGVVSLNANCPVCAQALEDSLVLAIPSGAFRRLLEVRPHLSFGLMKLMTGYIQEMQERYREMATEKVEQRVARVLVRLAGQIGKGMEQGVLIQLPFSRQELAEMAGTTIYTVSRTLSAWEKQGMITTGRERIILSNPHAIVCIAEGLEVPAKK